VKFIRRVGVHFAVYDIVDGMPVLVETGETDEDGVDQHDRGVINTSPAVTATGDLTVGERKFRLMGGTVTEVEINTT
jgi:hypothetical protein